MKRTALGLVFTLLLLPLPIFAPAQTAAPLETWEIANGRFWRTMSPFEKALWIWGFQSGVLEAGYTVTKDGKPPLSEKSRLEITNHYFPNLSREEIAKGMDSFYATPENAPVDAPDALEYVTRKAKGAQQWELDTFAAALRKASAQ